MTRANILFINHTINFTLSSANFLLEEVRHHEITTLTCKDIRTAKLLDVAHMLQFYESDSSQTEIAGSVTRKLRIKKETAERCSRTPVC